VKFLLEAKPKWLFIGLVTFVLGAIPFVSATAGVVTNDLATGRPEPEVVIVRLAPTIVPLAPTPSATPVESPTPIPTNPPQSITIEQPTIVIEQPDLAPILEAIAAIETNGEPIDLDALAQAIASAFADGLQFTIELMIDGEPTTIVCDTRGSTCESPPFGRE